MQKFIHSSLMAVLVVPLNQPDLWQDLKYSSIQKNVVEFKDESLLVKVKASASPLIYPLPRLRQIKSIMVKGWWKGQLNIPKGKPQGLDGIDDFVLRIGLVVAGDKTLSWLQKAIAKNWVKKLYSLAPVNSGIDRILFLNAVLRGEDLKKPGTYAKKDLIFDKNVWLLKQNGPFKFKYEFKTPLPTLALWLAIDGDNSDSTYEVILNHLSLEVL